jgi:hypothetical protein
MKQPECDDINVRLDPLGEQPGRSQIKARQFRPESRKPS